MKYPTPRLEIYPTRIRHNARAVLSFCKKNGISPACVTKVSMAHHGVVAALAEAGAAMFGDSRLDNLAAIRAQGHTTTKLLIRMPSISEALQTVQTADISLNSSLETLQALNEAATLCKTVHKVMIMIDVGDLREGVWPDKAPAFVKKAAAFKHLEIAGMGCNLACYGGVVPSADNMKLVVEVWKQCRAETGLELGILSGGSSANLPLLLSGAMPKEINHLRIGESIVLGRNALDRSPWHGTRQDTFKAVAEVIEIGVKPSVPIGRRGQDAFGGDPVAFTDKGKRRRAICALGRQDVAVDGLTPCAKGIEVLGGSSDHLILDIEEAETPVQVGGELEFFPTYGALLALFTSPYIHKVLVSEDK